jgi:uncharacterized SAM-binding protein YcdF (DUF218 family)
VVSLLTAKAIPLATSLVIAAALALSFTSWHLIGRVLLLLALLVFWITASPIFANWLNWQLETQFPPISVDKLPQSDAVIVLGGVVGQPEPERGVTDLSDTADRIIHALRIYKAGKAPLLIISAGNQAWHMSAVSEAQLIAEMLIELGVPRSALMMEARSRNTHENATNTAALFKEFGWRSGLLVTSSAHMPRALAAFKKAGVTVTPAATDFRSRSSIIMRPYDLMPDVGALAWTTSALKEMIGFLVYRVRGWV